MEGGPDAGSLSARALVEEEIEDVPAEASRPVSAALQSGQVLDATHCRTVEGADEAQQATHSALSQGARAQDSQPARAPVAGALEGEGVPQANHLELWESVLARAGHSAHVRALAGIEGVLADVQVVRVCLPLFALPPLSEALFEAAHREKEREEEAR